MITYDDIPMHGRITIEEHKDPVCCSEACKSFEQTDNFTLIPRGGRCSRIDKNGSHAVVFEGDECLVDTLKKDAA